MVNEQKPYQILPTLAEAKLSVVEWCANSNELVVKSLHLLEEDPSGLRAAPVVAPSVVLDLADGCQSSLYLSSFFLWL